MTTVSVVPTQRWNPGTITVPGHGTVSRPSPMGETPVEVTTEQADYLLKNFLAKPFAPEASEPEPGPAANEGAPPQEPTEVEVPPPPPPPEVIPEDLADETKVSPEESAGADHEPPPPPEVLPGDLEDGTKAPLEEAVGADHEPPPPPEVIPEDLADDTKVSPEEAEQFAETEVPPPTVPEEGAEAAESEVPPPTVPKEAGSDEVSPEIQEAAESEVPPPTVPEASLTDQERLVDFFETASESDIEAIKGIGQATAQELISGRPLTWEKVDRVLSQRQIDNAIAHIK